MTTIEKIKISCDNWEYYCRKNYNPLTTGLSLQAIIKQGYKTTIRYKGKEQGILELMTENGAINPVILPLQ